jgi:hypothetical protein
MDLEKTLTLPHDFFSFGESPFEAQKIEAIPQRNCLAVFERCGDEARREGPTPYENHLKTGHFPYHWLRHGTATPSTTRSYDLVRQTNETTRRQGSGQGEGVCLSYPLIDSCIVRPPLVLATANPKQIDISAAVV